MPFTPQYAYPVDSSANIGYTSLNSFTNTQFGNGVMNIDNSLITLSAGVWLVEAQLNSKLSNSAHFMTLSLSTTSGNIDLTRQNFVFLTETESDATFQSHMTSVFSLTEATIIYMVSSISSGESYDSNNKTYMTYTRLA